MSEQSEVAIEQRAGKRRFIACTQSTGRVGKSTVAEGLQDEMHSASLQKGPHQEFCATLASLLRPWLRDGRHGALLDGASNVDLGTTEICESETSHGFMGCSPKRFRYTCQLIRPLIETA